MTETEIQMARRHVRQGEVIVARQREIVDRIEALSGVLDIRAISGQARVLLDEFELSLALHRSHLAALTKRHH